MSSVQKGIVTDSCEETCSGGACSDTETRILSGGDSFEDNLVRMQEESLLPIIEDITDWLSTIFDPINLNGVNFLNKIDNGVILCKLIAIIQQKATSVKHHKIPLKRVKFRKQAESGSWFARDNIASFLSFCEDVGVNDSCMFETEDLALATDEIDALSTQKQKLIPQSRKRKRSLNENEEILDLTAETKIRNSPYENVLKIEKMHAACRCQPKFEYSRIQDGIYKIGNKRVFIRLLKGKHWMVRVGGGWNTLAAYVNSHDPCLRVKRKKNNIKTI